jgi:tRNA(His) 5'-end guanylyltransferase
MRQKTLHQRQKAYEAAYDQAIIARIPVVVKLDGRGFQKVTHKSNKPFDDKVTALLGKTMLACVKAAEGAAFGYQYSDKIILILRNDQSPNTDPWFGNHTQKIGSFLSSVATHEFVSALWQEEQPPEIEGPVCFSSLVFAVPNVTEAINYLIYRQLRCMQDAVNSTAYTHLADVDMSSKTIDERKEAIEKEAGIVFDDYPSAFRIGVGTYLTPSLISTPRGQITKQKWFLNTELPLFSEHKDFLKTILTTGSDIFRPDRDLEHGEVYQGTH